MGIYEVFIIYLAIGTPIGVYAIAHSKSSFIHDMFALLAANILFWPIIASFTLFPRSSLSYAPEYLFEGRPKSVPPSVKITSALDVSLSAFGRLDLKSEALQDLIRFEALSIAVSTGAGKIAQPEIFKLVDHPNGAVAAKCLYRRNLRRLLDHQARLATGLSVLAQNLSVEDQRTFESAIAAARPDLLQKASSQNIA